MEDEKMTIFFSKRTGEIKSYTTGITDMGYFGEDEEDFSIIYDFLVTDLDMYVLNNINQFKVEDKEVVLKEQPDLFKYVREGGKYESIQRHSR